MIMTMLGFLAAVCAEVTPPNASGSVIIAVARYLFFIMALSSLLPALWPVNGQTSRRVVASPFDQGGRATLAAAVDMGGDRTSVELPILPRSSKLLTSESIWINRSRPIRLDSNDGVPGR